MINTFVHAFSTTFTAVLQIIIVAFVAGILVRRNVFSKDEVKAITAVTVNFLLPCLTFSSILKGFYPSQLSIWPILPLAAVAMIAFGLLTGVIFFAKELPQKRNMLPLAAIQNANYLVLPLGAVLFPDQFDKFKLYCFLYILGLSPILWSLGKYLVCSNNSAKSGYRELITPPFVANVLAVVAVFTHIRNFVPKILLDSMDLIGSAAVPMATVILGAILGGISFRIKPYILDTIRVTLIKMILLPLCTVVLLYLTGLKATWPLLASFLVIQASSAPATTIVIQTKHYGGDEQKINSIVLFTYIFCIFSIPFWVALWNTI